MVSVEGSDHFTDICGELFDEVVLSLVKMDEAESHSSSAETDELD